MLALPKPAILQFRPKVCPIRLAHCSTVGVERDLHIIAEPRAFAHRYGRSMQPNFNGGTERDSNQMIHKILAMFARFYTYGIVMTFLKHLLSASFNQVAEIRQRR